MLSQYPGTYGIKVYLRDSNGELIVFMTHPIPPKINNTIEAYALLQGLSLVKKLKIENILIEGDSMVILKSSINKSSRSWKNAYILHHAWASIDSFTIVSFSHMLHEGNGLVYTLANIRYDNYYEIIGKILA